LASLFKQAMKAEGISQGPDQKVKSFMECCKAAMAQAQQQRTSSAQIDEPEASAGATQASSSTGSSSASGGACARVDPPTFTPRGEQVDLKQLEALLEAQHVKSEAALEARLERVEGALASIHQLLRQGAAPIGDAFAEDMGTS